MCYHNSEASPTDNLINKFSTNREENFSKMVHQKSFAQKSSTKNEESSKMLRRSTVGQQQQERIDSGAFSEGNLENDRQSAQQIIQIVNYRVCQRL